MSKLLVCVLLALADIVLCCTIILVVPMIIIFELADVGKFPLSVYAWKEMK